MQDRSNKIPQHEFVFSIDYDSCLNNTTRKHPADFKDIERAIIEENRPLFCKWKEIILEKFNQLPESIRDQLVVTITIIVGSNRQTIGLDFSNNFNNINFSFEKNDPKFGYGSAYPVFVMLEKNLKVEIASWDLPFKVKLRLHKFLLQDALGNHKDTFEKAMAFLNGKYYYDMYDEKNKLETIRFIEENQPMLGVYDRSKISLLHTQIHKITDEYFDLKNDEDRNISMTYCFFDDNDDILKSTSNYFSRNPHSIPEGCEVQICPYAVGKNFSFEGCTFINGTGNFNPDYNDILKEINAAIKNEYLNNKTIDAKIAATIVEACFNSRKTSSREEISSIRLSESRDQLFYFIPDTNSKIKEGELKTLTLG